MSLLPPHVGVGKYTPRGKLIVATELGGADFKEGRASVRRYTLAGLATPDLVGRHRLQTEAGKAVELEVRRRGKCFDLAWSEGGAVKMQGMGIPDPQSPGAILVGWWSAAPKVTGIVKYMISADEADTVRCVYTSVAIEMANDHGLLGGRAIGDTSTGFPGRYEILYEGLNGHSHGPFAWTIHDRGGACELSWHAGEQQVMHGFGFTDPDNDKALIVTYWHWVDQQAGTEAEPVPVVAPAEAGEPPYSGLWKITVKSPVGDQAADLRIVARGNRFEGSNSNGSESISIRDGSISGNSLKWTMQITKPMKVTLKCAASIEGDTLSGKYEVGIFGKMAVTGQRVRS